MVGTKPLVGALLAVGLTYAVSPSVALYRLGQAIRSGDAASLQAMVDWNSVREGIKEDICDFVVEQPQAQSDAPLPPFGAGFVRGIAANVVDRRVTAEALVAAAQEPDVAAATHGAVQVNWAFFAGPSAFVVDLSTPGEGAPIRLQMDLRNGAWHVTRVWLPPDLLGQANTRT